MAKLRISTHDSGIKFFEVRLSRRNLLSLLHKLDQPDSGRLIYNADVQIDGEHSRDAALMLVAENDREHYVERPAGRMSDDTEEYVVEHGGIPGVDEDEIPGTMILLIPPADDPRMN